MRIEIPQVYDLVIFDKNEGVSRRFAIPEENMEAYCPLLANRLLNQTHLHLPGNYFPAHGVKTATAAMKFLETKQIKERWSDLLYQLYAGSFYRIPELASRSVERLIDKMEAEISLKVLNELVRAALYTGEAQLIAKCLEIKPAANSPSIEEYDKLQEISELDTRFFELRAEDGKLAMHLTGFGLDGIGALIDKLRIYRLVIDLSRFLPEEMQIIFEDLAEALNLKELQLWNGSLSDEAVEQFAAHVRAKVLLLQGCTLTQEQQEILLGSGEWRACGQLQEHP